MKFDSATKAVSIFSGIVAALVSAGGFYVDSKVKFIGAQIAESKQKIDKLNASVQSLLTNAQTQKLNAETEMVRMQNAKIMDLSAADVDVEFYDPNARAFAIQYYASQNGNAGSETFVPEPLASEFEQTLQIWRSRHDLMTGNACGQAGLSIRQIITLKLTNRGYADTENLTLTLREFDHPGTDYLNSWKVASKEGGETAYYELLSSNVASQLLRIPLPILRGSKVPGNGQNSIVVVLASVSGPTSFYGNILVPVKVTWTDSVTNKIGVFPIMQTEDGILLSELAGAQVGTVANVHC